MKLQRKLLLGSAVVMVTTVGLGGYTIRSISTMNGLMTTTYDNALMASPFSQSAHAGFIKMDRALKDSLAAATIVELDRAAGVGDDAEKTFLEDLDVVKERALTKDGVAIVADIRQLHEQ